MIQSDSETTETDAAAVISPPKSESKSSLKNYIPLAVLVVGLALFFVLDLDNHMTFETLRDNRDQLRDYVSTYPVWSSLLIGAIYAVVIAFSLPVGVVMTLAAGFLLGPWKATLVVVVGATIGAIAVFMAARSAFGAGLRSKAGPFLGKLEAGFNENAMNYLLVLRLIPLFPFWLVNIVPAMLNVRLKTYAVATFIGIIPGTFAFADFGNGLGVVFDNGLDPDLDMVLDWQVMRPLIALSLVSLLPVGYKKYKAMKSKEAQ